MNFTAVERVRRIRRIDCVTHNKCDDGTMYSIARRQR